MRRLIWTGPLAFAIAGLLALRCGGSSNSNSSSSSSGGSSGTPSPASECGSSIVAQTVEGPPSWKSLDPLGLRTPAIDRGREAVALHKYAVARQLIAPQVAPATAQDVGNVAIIGDEGDVIIKPNAFDLNGVDLHFARNGAGGYDLSKGSTAFQGTSGDRITLADDATTNVSLPFAFSYYGKSYTDVNLNSDGNLTFEEPDTASSDRNITRFLTGPPRIAPFFSDLDPSTGGFVRVVKTSGAITFTWCGVKAFGASTQVSAQAVLHNDGTIDFIFGANITVPSAVIGVSPGHTADFTAADLSKAPVGGGSGAVAERFAQDVDIDLVALAKKFYQLHADAYDELVIWTDTAVTHRAFSYEAPVANEVLGIGQDIFDFSREAGSPTGQLRSFVVMDRLGKFPADPTLRFLGENNTLSVVGQESGHRWLAYLQFRDGNVNSKALLGRDFEHWNFFLDSDASVMEGNAIDDLGGGSFQTVAAVDRYSALDQYAMGLRAASDVPSFFYVDNPNTGTAQLDPTSAPRVGIKFTGTRKDVTIQQVVAALGPRVPDASGAPKVLRQAFIFVTSGGATASGADVQKVDLIRTQWQDFFGKAVGGRGQAVTQLH